MFSGEYEQRVSIHLPLTLFAHSVIRSRIVPTWHQGKLFARVGFIVTNLSYPTKEIVSFYDGRGTAE